MSKPHMTAPDLEARSGAPDLAGRPMRPSTGSASSARPGADRAQIMPLRFGIFDWLDDAGPSAGDIYEGRLKLLEYAGRTALRVGPQAGHRAALGWGRRQATARPSGRAAQTGGRPREASLKRWFSGWRRR
jgi:hypothetical protein